jgi:hypothetical protein
MAVPAQFDTADGISVVARTRHSWHQVGEWLLAGPQHRDLGTIRLQVVPGGFATRDGSIRVDLDELVLANGARVRLTGSLQEIAGRAGITGGAPEGLYTDSSEATADSTVEIDRAAAAELAAWLQRGDSALRAFAPDETPVLWPEHFDIGIGFDEVNYGISPGDAYEARPYAYVGPWVQREGEFWNAPFGAVRTWDELADEESVQAFFTQGKTEAARTGGGPA